MQHVSLENNSGSENAHMFQKMFSENMHCGNIRAVEHYPKFQLCEHGPKATAIPECLVQPVIKHHVQVPNGMEYRALQNTPLFYDMFLLKTTVVLKMRTYFKRCFLKTCIVEIYVP